MALKTRTKTITLPGSPWPEDLPDWTSVLADAERLEAAAAWQAEDGPALAAWLDLANGRLRARALAAHVHETQADVTLATRALVKARADMASADNLAPVLAAAQALDAAEAVYRVAVLAAESGVVPERPRSVSWTWRASRLAHEVTKYAEDDGGPRPGA